MSNIKGKSAERIEWVDVAKGIAILLMIIGHEIGNLNIHALIFSFHMPLFFILSGYTSSRVDNWQKFIRKAKKSFTHVWLLAVLMVILLGIESLFFLKGFHLANFYSSVLGGLFWGSNVPSIGLMGVGVMWFLFVFFWAKLLFDMLQVLLKDAQIGAILLIMSGLSYLFCNGFKHFLPQALDIVPFAALFMWIGAASKKLIEKGFNRYLKLIVGILLIYWLVCLVFHIYIELSIRHYPLFIVCILEAAAGTLLVCLLSKWIVTFKWANTLRVIGQHTLAVLCIHHLDLYWIDWGLKIYQWELAVILRLVLDLIILVVFLFIQRKILAKTRNN